MDVTNLLLKNIVYDLYDVDQNIEIEVTENLMLVGTLRIVDNREFSPYVNECDGLQDLICGELELDYNLSLIDENEKEFDFDFDDEEILDWLN